MRTKIMFKESRAAFSLLALMTLLLAVVVPLLTTVTSQLLFPTNANGSLILRNDKVIGSALLGQNFTENKYFWGRLSATTPPYNAAASGASNLSPGNALILDNANKRMKELQIASPSQEGKIPLSLITASASGLDPHITPEAAHYQVGRVAKARKISEEKIRALVEQMVETPWLGMIGEPRVNVLRLNLALDEAAHE